MDWNELNNVVKQAKKNGDPIANMIHKLKLNQNQVKIPRKNKNTKQNSNNIILQINIK